MSVKLYGIILIILLLFTVGCRTQPVAEDVLPDEQGTQLPAEQQEPGTPSTDPGETEELPEAEEKVFSSGRELLEYFSNSLQNRRYEVAAALFTPEMREEIALYGYDSPATYLADVFNASGDIRLEITRENPDAIHAVIHRVQGSTGFVAYRENGLWTLGFDLRTKYDLDQEFGNDLLEILEPLADGRLTTDGKYFVTELDNYLSGENQDGLMRARSLADYMYDYFLPVFYTGISAEDVPAEKWDALQNLLDNLNRSMLNCLSYAEDNDSEAFRRESRRIGQYAQEVELRAGELMNGI